MNKRMKRTIMGLSMGALLLASSMAFSEPGSEKDPLVTLSYVNDKIENLKDYIDVKIGNLSQGSASLEGLEIVELKSGQKLIAKAGTEIIIRGGKSTAYGVKVDKGLADVTKGVDIDNEKDPLPFNHLLIIPRDDGRGAYAHSDSVFMVKGAYEIE